MTSGAKARTSFQRLIGAAGKSALPNSTRYLIRTAFTKSFAALRMESWRFVARGGHRSKESLWQLPESSFG